MVYLTGSYHTGLVLLSILVAMMASYTAFNLTCRVIETVGRTSQMWLIGGAVAMGSGIWSMHFIGMLAFSLPIKVSYDFTITLISMLPAVFSSAMALHFMARVRISWWRLNAGGLLMALGIGGMHYTGMEAMRMEAMMGYQPILFALSILVAHVL